MTVPSQNVPVAEAQSNEIGDSANAPDGWQETRGDSAIQYEEVRKNPEIQYQEVETEPREPGWFEEALKSFFEFLGDIFSPIGHFLGGIWPVLQWVLLALAVAFAAYVVFRMIGPISGRNKNANTAKSEAEWQPDEEESVALLGDADALAAQGKYDEATHLLLLRSVGQIAAAKPEWVEPSSTARELAVLPALSQAARTAFGIISERVERSLFALRPLDREDWEAARAAYANFALVRIEALSDTALKEQSA